MQTAAAVIVVLALALLCAVPARAGEKPPVRPENQAFWRRILQQYRDDGVVRQILLVRCRPGGSAAVRFYRKLSGGSEAWDLVFETDGYIGKNGTGKTREGDGKTPLGDFGVREAFGILDNPGTSLPYINVNENTYACDEDSEYYNRIIDREDTEHSCKGERMYDCAPAYNYGIAIDYNPDCVWPRGSAIFLHCKGSKGYTSGCVAIGEAFMKTILECAGPGMRIVIYE